MNPEAAIQLKIEHWLQMAMAILKANNKVPDRFEVIATSETIEVSYADGKTIDGEEFTYKERSFEYTHETTDTQIYEFLEECVIEARFYLKSFFIV